MLTSASVWNVFWVPQLGSMLYCMNGMAGTLYLQADQPGVYRGESAMISGDGFADMHFNTDRAAPARIRRVGGLDTRALAPPWMMPPIATLLRQSAAAPPYTYRSVRPGLFADIVLQKLPPGEGPRAGVTSVHPVGLR